MNYKELIAKHINTLAEQGNDRDDIAQLLGFKRANVVSMHSDPTNGISPFPLTRLPALARACHLTPKECVDLIWARATDYPERATSFDRKTYIWMMRITAKAARALKLGKGCHEC